VAASDFKSCTCAAPPAATLSAKIRKNQNIYNFIDRLAEISSPQKIHKTMITRKKGSPIVIVCLAALLALASISLTQAGVPTEITGNLSFVGSVTLDTPSASTANAVTGWFGFAPGGLPQVSGTEGSFVGFVTPGDGVTFHSPWNFISGPIPNFWSVDNFVFDLTSSAVTTRTASAVVVTADGILSGNGFLPTPGIFRFSTQDPSAAAHFSFSASTSAVPEASTISMLLMGAGGVAGLWILRRKRA
jgi:hypothetical protein